MNDTILKFGYPQTLLKEYEHWLVLLRPQQPTLGSLVLAAKSNEMAFASLGADAFSELKTVTGEIEATLSAAVRYERINYLMLMMVDPHVHFHVIPRYGGERKAAGFSIKDAGWPKAPDLGSATALDEDGLGALKVWLNSFWPGKPSP